MGNLIKFGQGARSDFDALAKSQYEVYFCTDTHQIFVGGDEYTKGTKVLSAQPVETTVGDQDRLYAYGGNLYLCEGLKSGETDKYVWTRVANINDTVATVTSIEVGEGLTTASGTTSITTTDEIKHAVATGAAATTDDLADQTPAFGSTFAVKGVSTDKFGHVTAINDHAVTLPTQTSVTVGAGGTGASTLSEGGSFTVITGVGMSTAQGASDHDVVYETTTFTLPQDTEVTYSISSESEGVVTLTGSEPGSSSTALINGWGDLAKKSDITSVFKYKGSVASVEDLPKAADVGDVYQVGTSEYACVAAGTGAADPATWEELGPVVDLSAYATTAYVDEKLTWHEF